MHEAAGYDSGDEIVEICSPGQGDWQCLLRPCRFTLQQAVAAPRLRFELKAEAAFLGEPPCTADEIGDVSTLQFEFQLRQ